MPTVELTSQPVVVEAPADIAIVEVTDSLVTVEVPSSPVTVEFGSSATLVAGAGLTGGGYLLGTVNIALDAASQAALALANTALQAADLSGYQPLSANLTTFAGIAPTLFGQSLLGLAAAADLRTLADVYSTSQVYTQAQIDALIATLDPIGHTHTIANIIGLQAALDAKLPLAGGTLTGDLVIGSYLRLRAVDAFVFPINDDAGQLGGPTNRFQNIYGTSIYGTTVYEGGVSLTAKYAAFADNETITGSWTFDATTTFKQTTIGGTMVWRGGLTGAAGLGFRNDDGAKGYIGFDDNGQFTVWDSATAIKVRWTAAGALETGSVPWSLLTGVPATFTPSSHTHAETDITDGSILARLADNEIVAGAWTFQANPWISTASPFLGLHETDQGLDEKRWLFYAQGKTLYLRAYDDAIVSNRSILTASRGTGVAITSQTYGNSTDNPSHTFYGNMTINGGNTVIGSITAQGAESSIWNYETDAAVDEKRWRHVASAGDLYFQAWNDATSVATTWLKVNRTGMTIDSLAFAATAMTLNGTAVSLAGHSHAIADVTGLQTALDGKAGLAANNLFTATQRVSSAAYAPSGSNYHLELHAPFADSNEIALRFYQEGRWYHSVRATAAGLSFTSGGDGTLSSIYAGTISEGGTPLASKYAALSHTHTGADLSAVYGLDIYDVRTMPGTNGTTTYQPAPQTSLLDRRVTPLFGYNWGDSTWQGALIVKGWSGGTYAAWALAGPASMSAPEEWYLRSGIGATWNTPRRVWHAGNFNPTTKSDTSHNHSGVYQPLDADLTAIAALAGTSGLLKKTAADTWALDTNSYSLSSHDHAGVYAAASHTHSQYVPLVGGATLTASGVASLYLSVKKAAETGVYAGYQWKNETGALRWNFYVSNDTNDTLILAHYDDTSTYVGTVLSVANSTRVVNFGVTPTVGGTLVSLATHNHSGVYEPADATILKDADIGVTVAAFSHTHSYLPLSGGTLTAALTVDAASSQITLHETDAADTLDRALFELNANNLNLYGYDNSAATWRRYLAGNVTSGATTVGNSTGGITLDGATSVVGNLYPSTDSARTLGTSSLYWSVGYIDSLVTTGAIELGHTSDTSLTRLAAGKLGVEGKAVLKHAGSYVSGEVTVSTSAPTGGTDGDVWLKYTA